MQKDGLIDEIPLVDQVAAVSCGIYEGTIVRKNAVIGAGVILTSSMILHTLYM